MRMGDVSVRHEHNLARHASLSEQLLRISCFGKWKSLRDEWLNLFLLKKLKQGNQILSKQCRSQPFEPLDTVGDYPFPTRKKPASSDIQAEDGDCTKAMTTAGTTCGQSPPTERRSQAISHYFATGPQSLAGTPDVGAADAVKDDVYTLAREAVNFSHEVLMLVINRDTAQIGNGRRPSR